jgi:hypothetical protein
MNATLSFSGVLVTVTGIVTVVVIVVGVVTVLGGGADAVPTK